MTQATIGTKPLVNIRWKGVLYASKHEGLLFEIDQPERVLSCKILNTPTSTGITHYMVDDGTTVHAEMRGIHEPLRDRDYTNTRRIGAISLNDEGITVDFDNLASDDPFRCIAPLLRPHLLKDGSGNNRHAFIWLMFCELRDGFLTVSTPVWHPVNMSSH